MRRIEKDTRAYDRMIAQGKSYESLSKLLETWGEYMSARTIYRYITHKATPSKSVKKVLAKALNCAVEEIF